MSKKENVYVELHVVQNVPPSCINRDDTGSPKTAEYGGVVRARVSSQAWKHAMRKAFGENLPAREVGLRTKMIHDLVAEKISSAAPEADASGLAQKVLEAAGVTVKKSKKGDKFESDALFFISRGQINALAALALAHPDGKFDKKESQEALKAYPSIDIALFGRMVASDPSLNFDAAAQVAHAISTHEVHNEYDYFTAVDDCSPEDNAGAGHLGTVEYNSATLYRYAAVNVRELAENLGDDTARAVRTFADTFIRSMPEGKQNTFANRTLPDAVYLTIRRDQPVNMAGAFEKPVKAGKEGYVSNSVAALAAYAEKVYDRYIGKPDSAFAVSLSYDDVLGTVGQTMSLSELLDKTEERVSELLSEVE